MAQIQELNKANGLIVSSLERDRKKLEEKLSQATIDLEQKSSHLADTIVANHKLLLEVKEKAYGVPAEEYMKDKKQIESLQQVSNFRVAFTRCVDNYSSTRFWKRQLLIYSVV